MKRRNIVLISASVLILLIFSRSLWSSDKNDEARENRPIVRAQELQRGLIYQFTVSGEVTAEKVSQISSEFTSVIESVSVKPGDEVQEGDVLLSLRSRNVESRYDSASNRYAISLQNLRQTQISSEKSVESAEVSLASAERNLETTVRENKAKRIQAEERRKSSVLNQHISVETQLRNVTVTAENALDSMNEIMEFSQEWEDLNEIRETHIGVRDPTHKLATEDDMIRAYNYLEAYDGSYVDGRSILTSVDSVLTEGVTILRNSVISPLYPQSQLDSEIALLLTEQSSVRALLSQLESAQSSYGVLEQGGSSNSQAVISAQAEYDATIAALDRSDSDAALRVDEARISLENAIANSKVSTIGASSSLVTARGELDTASIENDKRIIKAEFSGTVTDVPVLEGDQVSVGTALVRIENDEQLKIVTFISGDEVEHVRIGDTVSSPDIDDLSVVAVSPSADSQTKKYKVELTSTDTDLRPGEFITLRFETRGSNPDALFVPISSVHVLGTESFVWTLVGDGEFPVLRKNVVTFRDIQGGFVEITGGLYQGDVIVTEGGRLLEEEGAEVQLDLSY